jgi:hypothetical protein
MVADTSIWVAFVDIFILSLRNVANEEAGANNIAPARKRSL